MARRYDFLTDRDIQDYVDGAVHGFRRRAIERHLVASSAKLDQAVRLLRLNADLRLLGASLYKNADLERVIAQLMRRASAGTRRKRAKPPGSDRA